MRCSSSFGASAAYGEAMPWRRVEMAQRASSSIDEGKLKKERERASSHLEMNR